MIGPGECSREINDECTCGCHNVREGAKVAHCMACCRQCHYCHKNISVLAYDEHEKQCRLKNSIHALDIELGYFDQHRKEWFEHHAGKFVLLKGTTVHDFYDTRDMAYKVGCEIWGLVPFLIKEVQLQDKVLFMPDRIVLPVRDEDQEKGENSDKLG